MPSQIHYCEKCGEEITYLHAIADGLCDSCTHKYFMTHLTLEEFLEMKEEE